MKLGQIVFIFSGEGWRMARVVGLPKGKVEVEHVPLGDAPPERQTYGERRIARVSAKEAASAELLTAYAAEVRTLQAQLDLEALWSLLGSEPAADHTASALAALALPAAGAASEDAMAWALAKDDLWFKADKDGTYAPHRAEVVAERRQKRAAEAAAEAALRDATSWLEHPTPDRPPAAARAVEALKRLVLDEDAAEDARFARALIRRRFPSDSESDAWIAFRTLVALGEWSPDENLPLLRARLPRDFPAEVLAAADGLAASPPSLARYTDRRALVTVAIDDAVTTEVDDALAIVDDGGGRKTVYVFITDASAWIPAGHPVDVEAQRRGATLYVPEGKVAMLPDVVGQGVASLVAGEDRPALGFVLELDAAGVVDGFHIEEAVIHIDARLTYEDVEAVLDGRPHAAADSLKALLSAADTLRKARREQKALILDRRDVSLHVEDGQIVVDTYRTDDRSRRLVSEWMVAACAHTALWCRDRAVPAVYRGQEPPETMPNLPPDRALGPAELNQILRTLKRADLRPVPTPHAGLGVPCYTQITSPLRRYQDLLMHRQLRGVLRTGVPPITQSEMMRVFAEVEVAQAAHHHIERESRRYWLVRSLERRRGERFDVEVLREAGRRWVLEILENGLQALWTADRPVKPGDRLTLPLRQADARRDRLILG